MRIFAEISQTLASRMRRAKLLDVELTDLVRFEEFKKNGNR